MYVKVIDGQPKVYSIEQLRSDNPNISFPTAPSLTLLEEWDVYPCVVTDRPTCDTITQMVVALSIKQVDGVWTQGWGVQTLPVEDAEHNIRTRRNMLLSQTDWMALSDNIMASEWATYRQSLRDITTQVGFPYAVTWPTKPE